MTLDAYRRFFAEEIEAACGLRTRALVEALAHVERERFLGPGPWITKGPEGDLAARAGRPTPDADPKRVYHNIAVAIDPARHLFNGQPGTVAGFIDHLALAPGDRVLHVGAATGYYTALMAHTVGPTGHVVAYEVDEALAGRARENFSAASPQRAAVEICHGDAIAIDGPFDAILVNAGATHPLEAWLDALAPGGRIVIPITFAFAGMPIGKGIVALLMRRDAAFEARAVGFVAIYSASGVRDETLNAKIGAALKTNPMPRVTSFRRDPHEPSPSCWLHGDRFCFEAEPALNFPAAAA